MRKITRFLSLLVLLLTAATGAWAQSAATHVVTQATVNDIFSGAGYTLGNAVKAGDVLDFQGTIDIDHSLVINKPVSIISSSNPNAVVKLNSASNTETPVNGDPGRAFVINKAGSGTTVQGIRIENTQTWLYNTSNVTFTGVTMWVEEATVGSGVGNVAIRYSDDITFDGCTVYTKNSGGSSACTLTGSHDCTFRNSRFEKEGNVGNPLFIGNPSNVNDKPADYTLNNDNISVINCTITAESSGAISKFQIMGGLRHRIENCTVNIATGISSNVTKPEDRLVIRNNTFMIPASVTFPNYSTVEGNTVTVNDATGKVSPFVTFNQGTTATNNTITVTTTGTGTTKVNVRKGATLTGNTINNNVEVSSNSNDFVGSTITGNTINGTVTFASNSKNNTLTRNVITSTGDYAVVMASTADANNIVRYNTLIAATKKGDEAVNPSTGTGNTISNNSNIALMLADGTKDAAKWTATVGEGDAQPLPVAGLNEGDAVTLTYGGRLKVKSVTATTDAEPTPLTIEAVTPGTIVVTFNNTTSDACNGMKYSLDGGLTKTEITSTTTIEGLKAGDKVQFYGNGKETQVYGGKTVVSIQGTGDGFQTKVYGNIMSLLDETGFATKTDLPEADYVFFGLFKNNTTLTDASELLLPATTLTNACYQQMFDGCTNLTKAPKLPAMTLADGCYAYMFSGCQLLTAAPKLPATTLDISCYYCMFNGCTSLTSAYVKAAYTGVNAECASMFDGCTADGAVLHTTPDNKARWEAKMGSGKEWPTWSVADDWQE